MPKPRGNTNTISDVPSGAAGAAASALPGVPGNLPSPSSACASTLAAGTGVRPPLNPSDVWGSAAAASFANEAAFAQRGGGGFGGGGFGGGRGGGAQNSSLLIFVFPKGFGISKDHKEVEFVTRVGNYTIKRKFKVKDMLYKGELAL